MSAVSSDRPTRQRAPRARPAPPIPTRAASLDPFRVVRRHLLLLIASVIFGGGLGATSFVALTFLYPMFAGEVIFEVSPGLREAGEVATQEPMSDEDVSRIAKTELVLAVSREVLTDALDDPDVQQKTRWFQDNFIDETGAPLVAEAVDELEEDLGTGVLRGTELFRLMWSTHEKADVPIILNSIANAYMAKRSALDNLVYNQNLELFRSQLQATHLEIKDLDQEIQTFITDADITSLEDPRYHEIAIAQVNIIRQISMATQALSMSRSGYLQTAAKLEGTLEPTAQDILEAEMDFSVASHIRVEENLKFNLRVAQEKFSDQHPEVARAAAQLHAASAEKRAKLDEIVRRNMNARLKQFVSDMDTYQNMLEELEIENEEKGEQLTELAAQQSMYEALKGQREHLETARDADRQLIKEIQLMRLRTDAERVAIMQKAQTPRELAFPLPEITIPLGVLVTLGLTMGIIFLREITDQRVKTAADLQILPGAYLLGVIPDVEEDPTKVESADLVVLKHPTSVMAESYRQVCTPIIKGLDRAEHQTLVLISGLPDSGTSTVAANIAAGCAATGRKTLIVDANFRRPRLADKFGLDPERPGLGDLLDRSAVISDAIVEKDGINVLTAGTPALRIIDRLNSEKFESVVAELRARYGTIIFDAPPAVVAGDAIVLANRLDAAVLVVRASHEHRGLLARVMNQITHTQCELLGIVLNRAVGTAGGYFKKNFATMAAYAAKTDTSDEPDKKD